MATATSAERQRRDSFLVILTTPYNQLQMKLGAG